jgi:hypothetical protein
MIYTIGSYRLNIPDGGGRKVGWTPHQVVSWRDCAETCRNLDAVIAKIPIKNGLRVIDGISRSGFWGAVFLNHWPDCNLIMNESDTACFDILKKNFQNQNIQANDINLWEPPESDVFFLDFDAFTLRKLHQHIGPLERIAPTTRFLMIADSACFGFKFGNIKHYGIKTEHEYYELLDKEMRSVLGGKRVLAVSSFSNSAIVLYGFADGKEIEYVPPSKLSLCRGIKPYKDSAFVKLEGFLDL